MKNNLKQYIRIYGYYQNALFDQLKLNEQTFGEKADIRKDIMPPSEIVDELLNICWDEYIDYIVNEPDKIIRKNQIPQFSKIVDGTANLVELMRNEGDYGFRFETLGQKLTHTTDKSAAAYTKYGENHAKLAAILDLVLIISISGTKYVYLTELGKILADNKEVQDEVLAKLIPLIPIVQFCLRRAARRKIDVEILLQQYVSKSTAVRRASSIRGLLKVIQEKYNGTKYQSLLHDIF